MPVNSIKEKEIRDRELDEKTQRYNELEFYYVWDSIIGGKCEPEPLTEYGQERIAEAALSSGFIGLWDLVYPLAADIRYQDLIPSLWKKYQCDIRGPKSPDVSTIGSRVGVWRAFLFRWAHGMVGGIRGGLRPIPYLPLHCFDEKTGRYERRDSKDFIECRDNGPEYISLEDLGKYLTNTIRIPLPVILFPGASESRQVSNGLQVTVMEKEEHGGAETSIAQPTSKDEDFIRALRISVENDHEIVIQKHGKRKIPYNHIKMGFQTAKKTWRDLLGILRDPEYCYDLGPATADPAKRLDYDAKRKRLDEINKKLVIFFNNEFSLTLPRDYKLYERDKTKRDGTYAFRFRKAFSEDNYKPPKTKFDNLDGPGLRRALEKLAQEYTRLCARCEDTDAETAIRTFAAAAKSGIARHVINKDQITDILQDPKIGIDMSKLSIENLLYGSENRE